MSNCLIIHSSERMTVSATGCIDMRLSSMTRWLELFGGHSCWKYNVMYWPDSAWWETGVLRTSWFGQVTRTNQPTLVGFGGKPGDQLILWTFSWSGHCNRTSCRGANTNVLGENGNRNRRRRRTAEEQVALAMSHMWHSLTPRDLCCSI